MALKKAFNKTQLKCEKDAKSIIRTWFNYNKQFATDKDIYIIWFAFTNSGYRCMLTSNLKDNLYFEIVKNMKTGEMVCQVFNKVECFVRPSKTEKIQFDSKKPSLI